MSWHEDPIDAAQADVAEDAYEAEPVAAVAQPRRASLAVQVCNDGGDR